MKILRQLTINQADRERGVTGRTIERRIQKGDIVASYVNGKRYFHISDNDATRTKVVHNSRTTDSDTTTQIETLRTELDTIRQERDYLRRHVAQLTATLYRLGDQKAIDAPQQPKPRRMPWWAFWRHSAAKQKMSLPDWITDSLTDWITAAIAIYGVALSTFILFRERAKLRVRVTVGPKPPDVGTGAVKYLIYELSNVGSKPIAVQEVGGRKKTGDVFKLPVYEPAIPVELPSHVGTASLYTRPIRNIEETWDNNWNAKDVANLAWLGVWDTTGKVHKVSRRDWKETKSNITEVLGRWY